MTDSAAIAERPGHGEPRPYQFPAFSHERLSNGIDVIAVHLPERELLTGVLFCYAAYQVVTGRPIHRLAKYVPYGWWVGLSLGVLAFGWGWKIIIQLRGVDGW